MLYMVGDKVLIDFKKPARWKMFSKEGVEASKEKISVNF